MGVIARFIDESSLSKRYYYGGNGCGYGYQLDSDGYCYYSGWYYWGRWVLLAVILVVAFLVFLGFSCMTARRRRKQGRNPPPFTGWMAPAGHGPAQYTGSNQNYGMQNQQYQAPNYPPPGGNGGYYGGDYAQEGGVTQPNATYQPQRGGDNVYAPPEGPPPGKKY